MIADFAEAITFVEGPTTSESPGSHFPLAPSGVSGMLATLFNGLLAVCLNQWQPLGFKDNLK